MSWKNDLNARELFLQWVHSFSQNSYKTVSLSLFHGWVVHFRYELAPWYCYEHHPKRRVCLTNLLVQTRCVQIGWWHKLTLNSQNQNSSFNLFMKFSELIFYSLSIVCYAFFSISSVSIWINLVAYWDVVYLCSAFNYDFLLTFFFLEILIVVATFEVYFAAAFIAIKLAVVRIKNQEIRTMFPNEKIRIAFLRLMLGLGFWISSTVWVSIVELALSFGNELNLLEFFWLFLDGCAILANFFLSLVNAFLMLNFFAFILHFDFVFLSSVDFVKSMLLRLIGHVGDLRLFKTAT